MKIKDKLAILSIAATLVSVVLCSVLLITSAKVSKQNDEYQLANSIQNTISSLETVGYEYLVHHERRMKKQWMQRYNSLAKNLSKVSSNENLVDTIRSDYKVLGELFEDITANYDKKIRLTKEGADKAKINAAAFLDERLTSRLLITSQSISDSAYRLSQNAYERLVEAQSQSKNTALFFVFALALIVVISTFIIEKSLSDPLVLLMKGVQRIGKGNLNSRVEVASRDELGALSTAFNKMANDLQSTTVSRNDLEIEQRRLAKSEAQIRAIIETAVDAIFTISTDGVIESANPSAERMFGYTNKEIVGKKFQALVPAFGVGEGKMKLAEGVGATQVLEARHNHNHFFPISLSLGEVKLEDYRMFTAVIQDITELKEKELDLELRNQELERFTYVASHDLQEPLRKIRSFGDLLVTDYSPKLDETGRGYVARMQDSAQRMSQLIRDLLQYTKILKSKDPFETVKLSTIVDDVLSDLEVVIEESAAEIMVADLPVMQAHPSQMRQLFQNLIGNAIKFVREGVKPMISIQSKKVDDQMFEITVTDNGIGIEDEFKEKIFQPFQRLHRRDEFEGTGIGLSVCQKIVERHGGTLDLESELGKGSQFIIRLPLA